MSRRRLIALIVLGILVVLPSAALVLVASTEWGLQTVATRLGTIGPVRLHVEGVSGTLSGGARIDLLDIEHERVHLRFTGIQGRLRLAPLLWQTISVPKLTVQTALIEVRRAKDPNSPWRPHFLPPLMRIHADSVHVVQGSLVVPNGLRFDATNADAAGAVYPKQVRILRGELDLPNVHLGADGRLLATDPLAFSGQANVIWQLPGQPRWAATASFDGNLATLPLNAAITAPFHAAVTGRFLSLTENWRFEGSSTVKDFDIVPFGGGKVLGKMSGALTLAANRDGFKARGEAESAGLNVGRFDVDFDGYYANRRLTIRESNITHQASKAHAVTRGTIDIVSAGRPQLNLSGDWQDFRWPLRGPSPVVRSASGHFMLRGDKPYQVDGAGEFRALDLPSMRATASGVLDSDRFTVTHALVDTYGGHTEVRGEAVWSPLQSWKAAGTATDIDMGQLRSDLPGRIHFDFAANGSRFASDGDLEVAIQHLEGKLRGRAASGSGVVERHGEDWRFAGVDLHLGRTRLTVDGTLGAQQRDLRFGLNTDDLSLLSADARGRIAARGTLSGTDKVPQLGIRAVGSNFALGGQSLRSIDADLDIDLRDNGVTRGHLRLQDLRVAGRLVNTLALELDGHASDNNAYLTLQANGLELSAALHGGFRDGRWKGDVQELTAGDGAKFKLVLQAPAALELAAQELKLGSLCLKGEGDARFCTAAEAKAGTWHANFKAEKLPLRTLTAGLSQDIDYDGTIGLDGDLNGTPDQPITGALHASLIEAQLRHHLSNGREEHFALGTGLVDASATHGDFSVKVGLDAGSAGNIKGNLDGRRVGADWAQFPVQGQLALETDGLGLLDVYVAGIDRAAGRLTTTATVTGTLGAPDFQGTLAVRQGEADLYQINLALREISLDASFNGNQLELSGSTRAGDGTGKLAGQIAWRDRQPFGKLHLEGANLRVVNVPEAKILASPNLDFAIAGNRINVTGEVRVPQAAVEPVTITNAVLSSSDEVLVGAPVSDRQQAWQVVSDIQITLGDKVNVDTYGLKGRIAGSIKVRSDETQVSRGSGELNVTEGKYIAFGRTLDIARGRLLFNNGPLGIRRSTCARRRSTRTSPPA